MSRDALDPAAPGGLPATFWDRLQHPDEEGLARWRKNWSEMLGKDYTLADAAEANRNFFGLLKVLAQINDRLQAETKEAEAPR